MRQSHFSAARCRRYEPNDRRVAMITPKTDAVPCRVARTRDVDQHATEFPIFPAAAIARRPLPGAKRREVEGAETLHAATTPVTPMTVDGRRYVAQGVPGSNWVANARVAGEATRRRRRRTER